MLNYIIKRILLMLITLFGITIIIFVILNISPMDPAQLALRGTAGSEGGGEGTQAADMDKEAALREARELYGLDNPHFILNTDVLTKSKVLQRTMEGIFISLKDIQKANREGKEEERKRLTEKLADARKDLQELGSVAYEKAAQELDKRRKKKAPLSVFLILGLADSFYPKDSWKELDPKSIPDPHLRTLMQKASDLDELTNGGRRVVENEEDVEKASDAFLKWWETNKSHYTLKHVQETVQTFVSGNASQRRQAADELRSLGRIAIAPLIPYLFQNKDETLRLETMKVLAHITRQSYVYKKSDSDELKRDILRSWRRWWEKHDHYFIELTPWQKTVRTFTHTRYGIWLKRLLHLDFGMSFQHKKPVLEVILERVPISLQLALTSLILVYLLAIPLGIYSATHKDMRPDRVLTIMLFILYSLPTFWIAILLIQNFTSSPFLWFPTSGLSSQGFEKMSFFEKVVDRIWHLILPVFCMTYGGLAYISRQMRAGMLESIRQDYIRTARAKGLPEDVVIFKHALRNSLIPILTLMAGLLPVLISGSVIIEYIFSIKGMGVASFEAATNKDIPMVMAIMTISAFLTLLGILIVDILYAVVDPRVSYD
ncbi:MAG: ABC transporter permease subunit [Planctomycetota bacterium]|nr:MAG: ABC transporter permease subunit [Planctomycetota bacterium]